MAGNRSSWRGGATSIVLWALLATAASLELYDEVPEVDSAIYQDNNILDTGPSDSESVVAGPDLALVKDLLLYRLIQSLHGASQSRKYRSSISSQDIPSFHSVQESPDAVRDKDALVKRLTNALRGSERQTPFRGSDKLARPQQKWKSKKGKALGSPMVCYFKLCAFRSPL